MTQRLADATGTSTIGGAERHVSRSLRALFLPVAIVGALLALIPLQVGDSRVLMGVSVLGLAFACSARGWNCKSSQRWSSAVSTYSAAPARWLERCSVRS